MRTLLFVALTVAAACSSDHYRKDADQEVANVLAKKERDLFGKETGFTVEQAKETLRTQLLADLELLRASRNRDRERKFTADGTAAAPDSAYTRKESGDAASQKKMDDIRQRRARRLAVVEKEHATELEPFASTDVPLLPARTLSFDDALEIAADNSRDYQRQKESVYTTALDLTFQRYLFDSRFGVSSDYNWTSSDASGTRNRNGTLTSQFSLSRKLATGGLLVFDFTNTLLKNFSGVDFSNGSTRTNSSVMDITFTQPLLRGAGAAIVEEPLVQSERDVYYELRAFERFRQEFAVSVAREFLNLLVQRDQMQNARTTYVQLIDVQEQSTAKGARGRLSEIQVSQAKQAELSARNSWIQLQRSYEDALDRFKITLGLPMEANFQPDDAELARLRTLVPGPPPLNEGEATRIALVHRHDYQTALDRVADAERRVNVAEDALKTALNASGGVSVPTKEGKVFDLQGGHTTWRAGLSLDLPVDRLSERNSYRSALISLDVQRRATSLAEDQLRQDVRDDIRKLAQLEETIRLQRLSVEVAERREASTALQLSMGRSQIRDYTDAVDSLNRARNSLTQALVDRRVGEFELSRDIGLIELGHAGIVTKFHPDDAAAPAAVAAPEAAAPAAASPPQ